MISAVFEGQSTAMANMSDGFGSIVRCIGTRHEAVAFGWIGVLPGALPQSGSRGWAGGCERGANLEGKRNDVKFCSNFWDVVCGGRVACGSRRIRR